MDILVCKYIICIIYESINYRYSITTIHIIFIKHGVFD